MSLPVTQLREYYDALGVLKEYEQTALAEAHARDPQLLIHRFRQSVKVLELQPSLNEPFYPPGRRDPPSPPTGVDEITSTIEFASQLCDRRPRIVEGGEDLGFRYVDRELSPLRSTGPCRAPRRSLDLLLANSNDRTPIFAELKIRRDRLAYFALVQALMLAVELLVPAQGARLAAHPPAKDLGWGEHGPFADVYIVAFDPPGTGTYRERSLFATERIAERLVDYAEFSRFVRRIAYIDASSRNGALAFHKRFAFGQGV